MQLARKRLAAMFSALLVLSLYYPYRAAYAEAEEPAATAAVDTAAEAADATEGELPEATVENAGEESDTPATDETGENAEGSASQAEGDAEATGDGSEGEQASSDTEDASAGDADAQEAPAEGLDEADAEKTEADAEDAEKAEEDADEPDHIETDEPYDVVESLQAENDGDIALRAGAAKGWSRIGGATAYDTMQKIVQTEGVFASGRGGTVVLATGDGYWDALTASGLAGIHDAPVLITPKGSLATQTRNELVRLKPTKVLVLGGTAALSTNVINEVKSALPGVKVVRIWGNTAADTAVSVHKASSQWGSTAIVATSNGYWDALSIAPYAYVNKAPIFLTSAGKKLSSSTVSEIKQGGFSQVIIVGGPNAVDSSVEGQLSGLSVKRIYGKTALDTSAEIAKWEVKQGMGLSHLTVATSGGYWDALSGAALCGQQNSVLVLVSKSGDYRALDAVYDYGGSAVEHGHILGGTAAVPKSAADRITAPWTLKNVSLTTYSPRKWGQFTATATGSGLPDDVTYTWTWTKDSTGSTGTFSAKGPTLTSSLGSPGTHTVAVTAKDSKGNTSTYTRKVYVYELLGLSVTSSAGGSSYTAKTNMGSPVGNLYGVQYRYTWARIGTSATGVLSDWSSKGNLSFNVSSLGNKAGKYRITVEVKDAAGSLGTKSCEVTVDAMTIKAQGYSSSTGWLIMVDETNCWVGIYRGSRGNWSQVRHFRVSCGTDNLTPHGTFYIGARGYSFGHGYTCYYWTDYWLGEWAFHSVLYEEGTMRIKDGRLGYHISAGCIRCAIEDAKYINDYVPYDTTVIIY